jgi:invasion protein IalB
VLTGVSFVTEQSEPLLIAPFKWCVPTRCLADIDLTETVINKMRLQKTVGRISYKNATQADVQIPLSFIGFSDAMDAFQKQ